MTNETNSLSEKDKEQKIQSLRDMITTAEQTMQSAEAMLLQLEGKKKVGRRKKVDDTEGNIVQGTFDGQIMIGTDGKQYPVPANYASKSKLVEGDLLKLTIVGDGSFIYKQVGPTPRQNKIGIVGQDANGNFFVAVDGKPYKVLLASITYFDVQPGDQVAIVTSQDENAQWAAIEAILQQSDDKEVAPVINTHTQNDTIIEESTEPKTATEILTGTSEAETNFERDIIDENRAETDFEHDIIDESKDEITIEDDSLDNDVITGEYADTKGNDENQTSADIIDEWVPDIEEIEKEIQAEMKQVEQQ